MNLLTKIIIILFTSFLTLFLAPWLCMIAWGNFAAGFNLPVFSYWHWFITILAIRFATGRINFKEIGES